MDAGSLDISGDADIDGTLEADAVTVNGSSLASVIQGTTVNSATTGTNVVITDNENTSETNAIVFVANADLDGNCLLYTSPSPRDRTRSRMPSSA